jgi:small redox-active disulfide protein 2
MKIQVFGSGGGCAPCKTMLANVQTALAQFDGAAELEYVTRIQQMLELGITGTPALVIDGEVKSVGKALDVAAIKAILASSRKEDAK